jgi:hypothetical protein
MERNKPVPFRIVHDRDKALDFAGGGGDSGGMEARVATLEQIARDTATTLADIKVELRAMRGEINTGNARLANLEGQMTSLAKVVDKIPSGFGIFLLILSTIAAVPTVIGALAVAAQYWGLLPPRP